MSVSNSYISTARVSVIRALLRKDCHSIVIHAAWIGIRKRLTLWKAQLRFEKRDHALKMSQILLSLPAVPQAESAPLDPLNRP